MDSRVIVICEECGRKYRVDPNRILGLAAGFSCRSCGHGIRVLKPTASLPARPQRAAATPDSGDDLDRLAAALGDTAERLRSRRRESPP
ncbi:MAG: zinc-ribbon domain-containing protein [Desulfobacterales bacterium]|jgi:hypothetical protein|nr:zinc-ribbon domain-containing protein [Desulfobacterales bacterium]